MKPLISVIIPTYNRAEKVEAAVKSVLNQTFKNFELFVIDDGSVDCTPEIINKFKSQLFYIYIKNSGVSRARNTGIILSRGKYLAFLDSDDTWKPRKLEKQVKLLEENPECLISQTEEIWIRNGKRVNPKKKHIKRNGDIFKQSLELCAISPSAVMMRKELFETVGLFDESFPVCEDYELWLRITRDHKVLLLDEKLTVKTGGHKDQLSKSTWGFDIYRVRAIEKLLQTGGLPPHQRDKAVKELIKKCKILESGFRKRNKKKDAEYFKNLVMKYK